MPGSSPILTPPFCDLQEPWCWYWDSHLLLLGHRQVAAVPCPKGRGIQGSQWHLNLLNYFCKRQNALPAGHRQEDLRSYLMGAGQ